MIYLYGYLGIGIAVLAVVYGAHRLTKEKESESLRELLEAVNPDRKKLSYRILNNVVAPIKVDGRTIGIVGFNQDITDRKRIEHALAGAK